LDLFNVPFSEDYSMLGQVPSRSSKEPLGITVINLFLHCALASCSAVYCNRSCLWVCVFATGGWCQNFTTPSARAVFVSFWALFHFKW